MPLCQKVLNRLKQSSKPTTSKIVEASHHKEKRAEHTAIVSSTLFSLAQKSTQFHHLIAVSHLQVIVAQTPASKTARASFCSLNFATNAPF